MMAFVFATTASAESPLEAAERRRPWSGLGRNSMSLTIGAYEPNIDANSKFKVYDCMFDGSTLPLLGGGGDFHLFDGFGSLQLSGGMDITQANGFAQPVSAASSGTCEEPTITRVQISFVMLRAGLTYRFDPLLDWWGVPLVPYGRLGLVGVGYLFSKDGEFVSQGDKHNPIGARYGYEGAVGAMLALDFLDFIDPFAPYGTHRARANGLFDHTFFFVEGAAQSVTNFGAPGFDLSSKDDFLHTGLPVLWRAGVAVELL